MRKIFFARKYWKDLGARIAGIEFSEEQLDAAEKHKDGLIGASPDGRYECYLIKFINQGENETSI